MTKTAIIPEILEITVGSAGGTTYGIRLFANKLQYLNIAFSKNEILTYDTSLKPFSNTDLIETLEIKESTWQKFISEMDRLKVFEWQDYYDNGSSNTTWWSLHLKINDKEIRSGGTGSWPSNDTNEVYGYSTLFKEFLIAVRQLIDNLDFGHF